MIQLIKEAQKGSDQAFLGLFEKYQEEIYRTAFVYVKNQEDALDVVQETAYRSFKSIQTLKEPRYFKTWLIRIAISCSIDILRKHKRIVYLKPEYEDYISNNHDEDISLAVTLHDLMEILNEDEKSVIVLRFYHDYTIQEIAKSLEIPLGSTKTILYRALKKLHEEWKGDETDE